MAVLLQSKPFYRFRASFKKQVTDITALLSQAGTKVTAFARSEWQHYKRKRSLASIYTVDQFLLVLAKAGVTEQADAEDLAVVLTTVNQYSAKFGNAIAAWDNKPGDAPVLDDLEKEILEPRNTSREIFKKLDAKYSLKSFIHWLGGKITFRDQQPDLLALFKNGATLFKVIVTHPQLYASYSRFLPRVDPDNDEGLNAGLQYVQSKAVIDSKVQAEKGWFTWRTATAMRYFIDKFLAQQGILDQNHCALIAQTDAFWYYAATRPGILVGRRERTFEEIENLKMQSPFFKARLEGISLVKLALNDENVEYFKSFLPSLDNKQILFHELLSQASNEEMEGLAKKYPDLQYVSLDALPDNIRQRWLKAIQVLHTKNLLDTQQGYIDQQQDSIRDLTTALHYLKGKSQVDTAGLAAENEALRRQLAEKNAHLKRMQQAQEKLFEDMGTEDEQADAAANLQAVQKINKSLQLQLKEAQEKLDAAEERAAELQLQLQREERDDRKKLVAAEANLELVKNKKAALEQRAGELELKLKTSEQQRDQLQTDHQALQTLQGGLQARLAAQAKESQQQQEKVQALEARVQELEALNTSLQAQKPAQETGKATVTIKRLPVAPTTPNSDARIQAQLKTALADLEQAQSEKRRLEQQLTETKAALEQARMAQRELSETKASIGRLQASLQELQATSKAQQAQFERVNAELAQNKKETLAVQKALEQANRENKTLLETKEQLTLEVTTLRKQPPAALLKAAPTAAKPAAVTADTKTEPSSELQFKLRLRANESEITLLKQQHVAKEKEVAGLQEQLTEMAKDNARLDAMLSQSCENLSEIQKKYEQLYREKESLTTKVEELLNPTAASSANPTFSALQSRVLLHKRFSLTGQQDTPPAANEDSNWSPTTSPRPTAVSAQTDAAPPAAATSGSTTVVQPVAPAPLSKEQEASFKQQRDQIASFTASLMQGRRKSVNPDSIRGNRNVIKQSLAEQEAEENLNRCVGAASSVSAAPETKTSLRPTLAALKPGEVPAAPPPPPPRTANAKQTGTDTSQPLNISAPILVAHTSSPAASASAAAATGSETPKGGSKLLKTFSGIFNKGDESSKDEKDKNDKKAKKEKKDKHEKKEKKEKKDKSASTSPSPAPSPRK